MRVNKFKPIAAAAALVALGSGAAQASIISVTASGGSESLLNVVDNATSASMSLDLGDQISGLQLGDTFTLGQPLIDFINGAGGLSGIRFSVIAGSATNGTSASTYLHSTDNPGVSSLANAVRGTWFSNFNNYVGQLNASNPGDTNTAVNNSYGAFASGNAANYITAGTDDWGTASTCAANDNVCNLVAGTQSANLFLVNFGTSPTGFANIQRLQGSTDAIATIDLPAGVLRIGPVVPVPAAVWLFGSALGLLGVIRRRLA
jgi:hypothetical protein